MTNAIQQQNVQAGAGLIGAAPIPDDQVLQYSITALGRLTSTDQFGDIILRTNADGGIVRVRDIARVELGAQSYVSTSQLNGKPAATMAVYQSPGSNALGVAQAVKAELEALKSRFPDDVSYQVIYDSTDFVRATIHEIVYTLALTGVIVLLVVFIFLQDWRATLIPALTIPVSLIGVFAVLLAFGFSANTVTLFALILAIGLVVDDAIVVVENVQRVMEEEPGIHPADAARKAMAQVTGPIISTTLVLIAVFLPVAFLPGITGQLYRQFAITITASVTISALNALTLSPALCAVFLRPPREGRGPFRYFNRALDKTRNGYSARQQAAGPPFAGRRSDHPGRRGACRLAVLAHADRLHPQRGPGRPVRQHPVARRRSAAEDAGRARQGRRDRPQDRRRGQCRDDLGLFAADRRGAV